MRLADVGDALLEDADAFDQPAEFLRGDRIVRRIAGINIGAAEEFEGTLRKAGVARPGGDQRRGQPFRLRAQEHELVGFGAIEGQHQQRVVVQTLGGLVQLKGCLFWAPDRAIVGRTLPERLCAGKPFVASASSNSANRMRTTSASSCRLASGRWSRSVRIGMAHHARRSTAPTHPMFAGGRAFQQSIGDRRPFACVTATPYNAGGRAP